MHSANFTALSRAVSFVFAPLLPVLVLEDALEPQPAAIRPIRPARPRATSGRSFLGMFAPSVIAASLDRAWDLRTWQGSRDRRRRGVARSARARCRRSGTARTRRRARTATPR